MLTNDVTIALSFILAVISLISVMFTDKKMFFSIITLALFGFFYSIHNVLDNMTILTFIMGISLLAIEIFIPSFGIIGIIGAILTAYSVMDSYEDNEVGIAVLVLSALAIILTVTIYVKLGFLNNLFDKFILKNDNSAKRVYSSKKDYSDLIGKTGLSKTILRPTGRVEIDGISYDVKSDSDFIAKEKEVIVTGIRDGQIIVKEKIWTL